VYLDEFKLEQADKALKILKKSELRAQAVLVR
jgi:hypothetical protein